MKKLSHTPTEKKKKLIKNQRNWVFGSACAHGYNILLHWMKYVSHIYLDGVWAFQFNNMCK